MNPSGIITLTTDFGVEDSYVGIMKGVILGIAPAARLIDITHQVSPQNIHQGAYMVQTFDGYFPPGTVHLVVVDPGVGGDRAAIVLETPAAWFVAPDNGVLTYVWRDALEQWGPGRCAVTELTERRYWLANVSSTFHGRDIFAPVAAHLARGVPRTALGPERPAITEAALEQPGPHRAGGLVGRIIHIDHFGNCITNITPRHLEQAGIGPELTAELIGQHIPGLYRTYAHAPLGALMALIGSSDRLEIAVRNGNAAQTLGVGVGDSVRVYERSSALQAANGRPTAAG
jgi:S-adenosylmethionine hydrolase